MQLFGRQGLLLAFAIALAANSISFLYGRRILLWTYRAKQLEGADPYGINKALTSLAKKADLEQKIKSYVIPSSTPNAFSLGDSVVITDGFLKVLDKNEQLSILAHEVAHIKNNDSWLQTSAAVMGSIVMYISQLIQWIIFLGKKPSKDKPTHVIGRFFYNLFAPLSALLVQIAVRKKREFLADEMALKLANLETNRDVLASALWKIHNYSLSKPMPTTLSTAHLFVVNPLQNKGIEKLFITHPPTEERIKNLIGRYP
ncbi:MAG: M48 family metalloprotease [Oligoflexia bacterium]|nr:M48 family metalloprotease [Oligoflexia bacterium]